MSKQTKKSSASGRTHPQLGVSTAKQVLSPSDGFQSPVVKHQQLSSAASMSKQASLPEKQKSCQDSNQKFKNLELASPPLPSNQMDLPTPSAIPPHATGFGTFKEPCFSPGNAISPSRASPGWAKERKLLAAHQQSTPQQHSGKGSKHTSNKAPPNQRAAHSRGQHPQRPDGSSCGYHGEQDSAVVTECESFFEEQSPQTGKEQEGNKRMTKKLRPERGIRDLKAYTQRETPPLHMKSTTNMPKRNLLIHLQEKQHQMSATMRTGISASKSGSLKKSVTANTQRNEGQKERLGQRSANSKLQSEKAGSEKQTNSQSTLTTSQMQPTTGKNHLITPIKSISLSQRDNESSNQGSHAKSKNVGAFLSQKKKPSEKPALSSMVSQNSLTDKYSTKTFQPRNALVSSCEDVSDSKSKAGAQLRNSKTASGKFEDHKDLGNKKVSAKSEFVQLVSQNYEPNETRQTEDKHGCSSTVSHRISASAFSPSTVREREEQAKLELINEHSRAVKQLQSDKQKYLYPNKVQSSYQAKQVGGFLLTPQTEREHLQDPATLTVKQQQSADLITKQIPPSTSSVSSLVSKNDRLLHTQPRKGSFLEGFLSSRNGQFSNTSGNEKSSNKQHFETMASVPDEIFSGQDPLTQKKPNQFMQRIKSKSELHRQKQFSSAQKAMQQERERIAQAKANKNKVSGFTAQAARQSDPKEKRDDEQMAMGENQELQNPYLVKFGSESEVDVLRAKKQQFSLVEAMRNLQFSKAASDEEVQPERISIKLQESGNLYGSKQNQAQVAQAKSQTSLGKILSPYHDKQAATHKNSRRPLVSVSKFEVQDDFVVIPDPRQSGVEILDECSVADTDERSETDDPDNEFTVQNLIKPSLGMHSSRAGVHSSAASEASPIRQIMNVSQKMHIKDYIRKENAKEKTHRNFKSEIPPLFENKSLEINKALGLSDVDPYKQGRTPRIQSSLGLDPANPSHDQMIKIIDNNSPKERDYNTKQSSVKDEDRAENLNKVNTSNVKAAISKKSGLPSNSQRSGSSLFQAALQRNFNSKPSKTGKPRIDTKKKQLEDENMERQIAAIPKSATMTNLGGKAKFISAAKTQSFTDMTNAQLAYGTQGIKKLNGPSKLLVKTPSKAQQLTAQRALQREAVLTRSQQQASQTQKLGSISKMTSGINVGRLTPTEQDNKAGSRSRSASSQTEEGEPHTSRRLSTKKSSRSIAPVMPVLVADHDESIPIPQADETPEILESKKQLFESVIESTSLTGSFMRVLNFNRFAKDDPEHREPGSKSLREQARQESEASSLEDGEQRYETDDEKNQPVYHPVVTEQHTSPMVNLVDAPLTDSNVVEGDIANEDLIVDDGTDDEMLAGGTSKADSRSMAQYSIDRKRRRNKFDSNGSRRRERGFNGFDSQGDMTSKSSKTIQLVNPPSPELNLNDLTSQGVAQNDLRLQLRRTKTNFQPSSSIPELAQGHGQSKTSRRQSKNNMTLKEVLDRRNSRSSSVAQDHLRSRSHVSVDKNVSNPSLDLQAKTTASNKKVMLSNFSSSLKALYNMGANMSLSMSKRDGIEGKREKSAEGDYENLDTQVMNFEADFELQDIGEEPIQERNRIKKTSTNQFKDKMSHLQYNKFLTETGKKQQAPRSLGIDLSNVSGQETNLYGSLNKRQTLEITPSSSRHELMRRGNSTNNNFASQCLLKHQVDSGNRTVNNKTQSKVHDLSFGEQAVSMDDPQAKEDPSAKKFRLEMRERRKSNVSTYVERSSMFTSAIDSLFGKDSVFSRLDLKQQEEEKKKGQMEKRRKTGQSLLANQRQSRSQGRGSPVFDSMASFQSKNETGASEEVPCLLPPMLTGDKQRDYTLVLDLDETLVHFDQARRVYKIRPLCLRFLRELCQLYEIVIFTAAHETYANFILDKLDPNKEYITHRLYRQHTTLVRGAFVKDLARIGRPLKRTLIIDNLKENFERQKANGIECYSWVGSNYDRQLLTLLNFLTEMALEKPDDIRPHIAEFKKTFNVSQYT